MAYQRQRGLKDEIVGTGRPEQSREGRGVLQMKARLCKTQEPAHRLTKCVW